MALLRRARVKKGLEIMIEKDVPLGLGLGSSGATAAACTKALDELLELKLSNDELVRVASLGEKAVAGTAHPDNVAASLLGGFVIVIGYPFKTIAIKPPSSLTAVVVTPVLPRRDNKTRLARKVIPKSLEVKKAVLNIGRASAIATGFAKGDIEMIGSGMEDEIAEPYREEFLPGYRDAKKAAIEAHAAGASISGAGPSILALVNRARHNPRPVATAMVRALARNNVRSTFFITRPAMGARVIGRN
jgi:homoserine kinase